MEQNALVGGQWIKARPEWVKESLDRKACLEMFMDKFGVDSPLVSVPKLAKVLGMSRQWIYGQIKAGAFFLPLRMAGATPLVPVDALIDWYLGQPSRIVGSAVGDAELSPESSKLPRSAAKLDVVNAVVDVDNLVEAALKAIYADGARHKDSRHGHPIRKSGK